MTELERLIAQLAQRGRDVERVEDGAVLAGHSAQLALFAEGDEAGEGVMVRAHLDLDLYVDEEALADVMLGVNLLNQSLDFGSLTLDPLESDEDERLMFSVLGRTTLLLSDLGENEIARLERHLQRFETEVSNAVERSLSGSPHMEA
ncbi:hypothetical protein [Deinococcus peraridilitoris]|nr:hypothetical protein [Deinococcus peraridilitoris]